MHNTNALIASAVQTATETSLENRSVNNSGNTTSVFLHDKKCLDLERDAGTVTLYGDIPPTRKSSRFLNAILSALNAGKVFTRTGKWFYRNTDGQVTGYSEGTLTVQRI